MYFKHTVEYIFNIMYRLTCYMVILENLYKMHLLLYAAIPSV
jgi:hypothetical protein